MVTSTIVRPVPFVVPALRKAVSTLLDVADVHDGIQWQGVASGSGTVTDGLAETWNCLSVSTTTICPDARGSKTLSGPAEITGVRINVYLAFVCKPFANDIASQEAKALEVFTYKETEAVELGILPLLTANAAITATVATPKEGLALLEGHAARRYAGMPVIHAPRSAVSRLAMEGGLHQEGNVLFTPLGSPVVSGAGYEVDTASVPNNPAGTDFNRFMFASGGVSITQGEIFVHSEMNRSTNEIVTLVERPYVAAVDCYTAQLKVKVVG